MLPLYLFRSRGFAVTNLALLLMFFGMFGSIFLLAQFLQVVQHYSPLQAGLRTLPWTAMPVFIAPVAGALSDRIGGGRCWPPDWPCRPSGSAGWPRWPAPPVPYLTLVPAFVVSGVGMSLFFAPVANVVLSSVRRDQEGIASGANNAIRELGGVFGIAVLGAVFSAHGSYASGTASSPPWPPRSGSAGRQWPSPRPPRCSCPGCVGRKRAAPLPSRSRNSLKSANQPGTAARIAASLVLPSLVVACT